MSALNHRRKLAADHKSRGRPTPTRLLPGR